MGPARPRVRVKVFCLQKSDFAFFPEQGRLQKRLSIRHRHALGPNQKNLTCPGALCSRQRSYQQTDSANLLREPGFGAVSNHRGLWNYDNDLHGSAPSSNKIWLPVLPSFETCDLQTSHASPTKAHETSRARRVRASVRPNAGDSPDAAKADIAPPSSAPRRAGTNPVIIFTPRVSPSMARTVNRWRGSRSDHKTTATSETSSNWHARSSQNICPTSSGFCARTSRMADSIFAPWLSQEGERIPSAPAMLDRTALRLAMNTMINAKTAQNASVEAAPRAFIRLTDTQPAMPTRAVVNQYTPLSRKVAVAVAATGVRRRLIFMGSETTGPNTVR